MAVLSIRKQQLTRISCSGRCSNERHSAAIAERLHVAEALDGDGFELEGHSLIAVGVGHTDTDNTTCLHIPSIDLVVAGDAVYNGVHLYLGETDATG